MTYYGVNTFHVKSNPIEPQDFQYHFVLISEETNNDYWRLIESGAIDAAKKHNVYLEYLGPSHANMSEHVRIFDKAIAGKVDGIMIQGISDKEFTPLINKAREKGISIVTIDTDAPNSRREVYVGTDNYQSGYMAGQALIEDTVGEQKVGVVIGRSAASNQDLRLQGFMDAIKSESRIQIVGVKESNITKTGAVQATYDLLKEHPDITAFYGTSALDGIGITQVIRTIRPNLNPYIITFDTLPETVELLSKGEIDAIVVQYPYEMGFRAVEMLIELKDGRHPEPLQYTKTEILHQKDLSSLQNDQKGDMAR